MTERKPAGKSFTSWIDQQIQEAQERGAFDGLPGAGKPLPRRSAADDGQVWLRDKLQREGVSTEELLPVPLKLRKQAERLAQSVQELATEQDVRDAVAELNTRIIEWRRVPLGPQIFVPLVSADEMVSRWRERHAGPVAPRPSTARREDPASPAPQRHRTRWWQRLGRAVSGQG
jgi:DnaJ-like protein